MKTNLILACVATVMICGAEDLTLKDGAILRNATLISADAERMLVVHDDGGRQLAYAELAAGTLSAEFRDEIEARIREHVAREARMAEELSKRIAYEDAQRAKGMVRFEGEWIAPSEREKILQARKTAALEREKLRVEIAKRRAELEKEEAQTERARQLLGVDRPRSSVFISSGGSRVPYDLVYRHGALYYPYPIHRCETRSWGGSGIHVSIGGSK